MTDWPASSPSILMALQNGLFSVQSCCRPIRGRGLRFQWLRHQLSDRNDLNGSPGFICYHESIGNSPFAVLDCLSQKLTRREQRFAHCFRDTGQVLSLIILDQLVAVPKMKIE